MLSPPRLPALGGGFNAVAIMLLTLIRLEERGIKFIAFVHAISYIEMQQTQVDGDMLRMSS